MSSVETGTIWFDHQTRLASDGNSNIKLPQKCNFDMLYLECRKGFSHSKVITLMVSAQACVQTSSTRKDDVCLPESRRLHVSNTRTEKLWLNPETTKEKPLGPRVTLLMFWLQTQSRTVNPELLYRCSSSHSRSNVWPLERFQMSAVKGKHN